MEMMHAPKYVISEIYNIVWKVFIMCHFQVDWDQLEPSSGSMLGARLNYRLHFAER